MKFTIILFISIIISTLSAWASTHSELYVGWRRVLREPRTHSYAVRLNENSQTGFLKQPINPANPNDQRTYNQRYIINSTFASGPDAPVIFYLCGEWDCDGSDGPFVAPYAQALKAHFIQLEHRYYGVSLPFKDSTPEHLQYLKVSFALSDAARFERFAKDKFHLSGKWIVMGASYSANLAAYYRVAYPSYVVGAFASSAPVYTKIDFREYDRHVGMVLNGPCSDALHKIISMFDEALPDPAKFLALKKMYHAENISNPADFMWILAGLPAVEVQYTNPEGFCKYVLSDDPHKTYLALWLKWMENLKATPYDLSHEAIIKSNATSNDRSWYYQTCNELGYWQTYSETPPFYMRSHIVKAEFFHRFCEAAFGLDSVNVAEVRVKYFLPLLVSSTTHILITNGSNDPWSELSLTPKNNPNPNLKTILIPGAFHCQDINPETPGDSEALKNARIATVNLLRSWLR